MNSYTFAWTVLAVIGGLLSATLIVEAFLDLRSLGPILNGRRRRVLARLVSEALRLTIHIGFAFIGFCALIGIDLGDGNLQVLIGASVILVVQSLIAIYVTRLEPSKATRAEAAAVDLLTTARTAARHIVRVAEQAAEQLKRVELEEALERGADAAERTAVNTERIAENTERDAS